MGTRRLLAMCILMAAAVGGCGGTQTADTSGPSEDTTAPRIVGTSPEEGATSVAPDAGFLVTFSEPMDTAGIEAAYSITPATDGTINWFADNSVMVFTPTGNWDYETRFTVAISATARDASGNSLGSSFQSSFTTAPDIIPPIIIGTSPIDGATPVEVGTAISIAFSEAMNRDTTESAISISPAAKGIISWSADDSVLTFTPSINWNYDVTYTVTLDANATDRAANPLASQRQFSFTMVPDATPPVVISTFPINGATSAELTVAVSVTFSETMERDLTESAVSITPAVYGTFAWSARGSVLTFTTPANWEHETTYTVAIDTTATDVAQNPIKSPYQFSFTTGPDIDPPMVTDTFPNDGSTDVARNAPISITFSEAVVRTSTEAAFSVSPPFKGTFNWSAGDTVLTFTPSANRDFETTYAVTMDTNAKDRAGYAPDSDHRFSFTTGSEIYVAELSWGEYGTEEGQFRIPYGSEIDDQDEFIYITDCGNSRVQKYRLDGTFVLAWGGRGEGEGDLGTPADIKLNSQGDVYVVEQRNHRVQKFSSNGTQLGSWGSFGAADGQFKYPLGLAIDSRDNIYVVDELNHRIQKFAPDGTFLLKWGTSGTGDGQFSKPYYIDTDSQDNVYVGDRGNHRIQKFTSEGEFLLKWGKNGGDGTPGNGNGEFNLPHEIAIDAKDRIYVADMHNHRFQVFTSEGEFIHKWGDQSTMSFPKAIAVDQLYNVYVTNAPANAPITNVTKWKAKNGTRPTNISIANIP